MLIANPGARQISSHAIQVRGAIMGVGPKRTGRGTPESASGYCHAGDLCLFIAANFGTPYIYFYQCNVTYNLYNYSLGGGETWADVTSSIDNPQTPGVTSYFYHSSTYLFTLAATHYLKDLANDPGPHNGSMNDWITKVKAC